MGLWVASQYSRLSALEYSSACGAERAGITYSKTPKQDQAWCSTIVTLLQTAMNLVHQRQRTLRLVPRATKHTMRSMLSLQSTNSPLQAQAARLQYIESSIARRQWQLPLSTVRHHHQRTADTRPTSRHRRHCKWSLVGKSTIRHQLNEMRRRQHPRSWALGLRSQVRSTEGHCMRLLDLGRCQTGYGRTVPFLWSLRTFA